MDAGAVRRGLVDSGIRGEVIGREHREFDTARRVWNGLTDRQPAAVVRAASTEDVVKSVRFAADHGLLLAIRGGGHSLPGLSTCDDGIVLDLRALNTIDIDPVGRSATVGGGCRLGDMDRATVAHGLVTPAGVVSHTGVGGLTLGGGMGWLSRRLGLTIDSLTGVEIVLADGRILNIDAEVDPELFWGLRGGGGNFGVVTAFRFRLHELGSVVIGQWHYGLPDAIAILGRYADLAEAAPRELTSAFTVTSGGLNVTAVWSGPAAGALDGVAAFGRIGAPIAASLGEQSFLGLQSRGDEHLRWGRRVYAKGGFFGTLDEHMTEVIAAGASTAPSADSEIYVLRLGGAIKDVDDMATAYTGRAAEHYWIVEPVWDEPPDDDRCLAWGRGVARSLSVLSIAGNYVNEQADADRGVAEQAYGLDTYRRLATLKARLDPGNTFRLNQNIAPAS